MIDYTVRRSPRARHVWLRFDREGRLTVVIPRRFDARRVPGIVESHAGWIERTRGRVEKRRRTLQAEPPSRLPETLCLAALQREWSVEYRATPTTRMMVREQGDGLVVTGPVHELDRCREALLRWLRRQGHAYFSELTAQLASENGFVPGKVIVRAQRTRWASCSRRGTLSLNVRLLFIAPELARHVLIHELCHTKHMDHSRRFWACVARHDPEWQEHRRRLRRAWHSAPTWLDSERLVAPDNGHPGE